MSRVSRIVSPHAAPPQRTSLAPTAQSAVDVAQVPAAAQYPAVIADFACVAARLVIGLDGSQHAHAEAADARRTAYLNAEGWTVVQSRNGQEMTDIGNVLRDILAHLPGE